MKIAFRKKNSSRTSGFTLIEMIIALTIFVIVILLVANIYTVINNSQRRVAVMQKLQDDVRYALEAMSQEVRLGQINYAFYQDPNGDSVYTDAIDLHPLAATPNRVLAVIDQSGNRIFYRFNTNTATVQYCQITSTVSQCRLDTDTDWQNITPDDVRVLSLEFLITPSADPTIDFAGHACLFGVNTCGGSVSTECKSYRWNATASMCQFFSDGHNYQPRVRIIIKTEGRTVSSSLVDQSRITMETVVTTRIATGKVQNTYHD